MLVSTYHLSDTERANARRVWIDARPLVIGSASDCHVVIDDPEIAPHHVRLSVQGASIVVENLAASIDVDGTPLATNATRSVEEGRPIRVGGTIVKLRMQQAAVVTTRSSSPTIPARPSTRPDSPTIPRPPTPMPLMNPPPMMTMPPSNPPMPVMAINPPMPQLANRPPRPRKLVLSDDPTEQELVAALRAAPGDSDARMVYADWLEERGLKAKTELVRIREHLDTFMHRKASDLDWRAVAVCTPIDHCEMNKCPKYWDALTPVSASDFVRGCNTCRKQVAYCADLMDAVVASWKDAPVVFDAALDRVAAHAAYSRRTVPGGVDDELDDDDPDGYTLDTPPSNFRK